MTVTKNDSYRHTLTETKECSDPLLPKS